MNDALDEFLRPTAPPERLALVRVLVGSFALVYLLVRFRYFADSSAHAANEFVPVGVARVLSTPLPPVATWSIAIVSVALGAAFVTGFRVRVTAPLFVAALLWLTTYRSSFGKILHTENLLVLHVLVLAISPRTTDPRTAGWALRTMILLTSMTYFVAGMSKLRTGGLAWLSGEPLGDWIAFDALRKIELGSVHSPLGPVVASSVVLRRGLAAFTLLLELGAPLAALGWRSARLFSLLAFCFHVGVLCTMAIGFFYPLSFVAFAPAFAVERTFFSKVLRRIE